MGQFFLGASLSLPWTLSVLGSPPGSTLPSMLQTWSLSVPQGDCGGAEGLKLLVRVATEYDLLDEDPWAW